jgi:hypothetical protein
MGSHDQDNGHGAQAIERGNSASRDADFCSIVDLQTLFPAISATWQNIDHLPMLVDAIFQGEEYSTMVIQDRARTGLQALTEEYTQRFAPASLHERFLVETLAISEWRSRHYVRMEADMLEHCPDAFCGEAGKDLDRLQRLADSAQRAYFAALKRLMDAQAKRAPKPAGPRSSGLFAVPKRSPKQTTETLR